MKPQLEDISFRHHLLPGDLGLITHLHGKLYAEEYGYGIGFEYYVATSLLELFPSFSPEKDFVWIAEYQEKVLGYLFLVHRGEGLGQLRYFILAPEARGIGLGKHMMERFMAKVEERGYKQLYLSTAKELETAASLYRKFGFRLVSEHRDTNFGWELTEQRYEWQRN